MRRLGLAAAVLLLAPAGADARPSVVQGADGLRLTDAGGHQILRFTGAAARAFRVRFAGKPAEIECHRLREFRGNVLEAGGRYTSRRIRSTGGTIRVAARPGAFDFCFVRRREWLVAAAAATALGDRFLDETATYGRIVRLAFAASPQSLAEFGRAIGVEEVLRRGRGAFVALDGPDATPAPGRAAYWTDGNRTVLAATTAAGKRLYLDSSLDADDVTTNTLRYRQSDRDNDDAFSLGTPAR